MRAAQLGGHCLFHFYLSFAVVIVLIRVTSPINIHVGVDKWLALIVTKRRCCKLSSVRYRVVLAAEFPSMSSLIVSSRILVHAAVVSFIVAAVLSNDFD